MSASNVYAAMDDRKYDVHLCYIDRAGKWWFLESWPTNLQLHGGVQLAPVPGSSAFLTVPGNRPIHIDVLFPVLHGENGHEDGAVQGLANLTHIPAVGSGLGASAVCWDKLYTKQLLAQNDIPVVPYHVYHVGDEMPEYEALASRLGEQLFVKPTVAGSSIGVSKVHRKDELIPAIEKASKHSSVVLIEQAITGRELEVAVLGNPPTHRESGVGEIIPGEEFYSYEDKYATDSKAQVVTKADIPDELRREIQQIAHKSYALLGCRGLARVDFFADESGVYLNEFNTLPGFTNISQYPKLWQAEGISYASLIDTIIQLALE
ncbi:hypothetical protein RAAC3_TM7C00001G0957 [Candidatus Saccharibacteria bacterium RAAC3_TM7_1]|nr:hypothetical protein RAAC3_TM7C00001G0957 [Candidatus Saccharibacteria bacterium RAAC3_TM7_1]